MPSPRLRLMPTTAITTAMDWPTMDMATPMPTMATTTERGLLMLSPRLMPTTATTTATDWLTTAMDMPTMDTTTERGPLMLSPRLMLSTATTATLTPPTDTAMPTMDTTATPTLTDTTDTDIIIKLFVVILFKN